ncbi:cell division inhibitor SepF [Naumannella cuiyingiana]|uniref:Cell division protein SepF n=1 Tax=Naumannella cuiyingiana TaxID=1347891 RepID=A0A7Z0DB69_9ACTN|nr:cell division protein SepF [Naumannella cuiyingiana]NYI72105.1 cell division inhibitor SepF [Naumannella cuiyingiana]
MADRIKRAAAWLGLVADDRYDDEYYDDELTEGVDVADERAAARGDRRETVREDADVRRPAAGADAPAGTVTALGARREPEPRTADLSRIITVHPRTYNEARTIGEHFRDGVPVIMNLSEMEDADAKRLVDFAAGLIFGLRGDIERVTSKVFLLSPRNINVTAEDKERIAGGFFNQS